MDGYFYRSSPSMRSRRESRSSTTRGATAKAASLKAWLSGLVSTYDDKIIGLDAQAAAIGGRLEAKALAAGHDPGMADAVIAGTAAAHELVIVTRNTKHFLPFGIAVLSPDEAAA